MTPAEIIALIECIGSGVILILVAIVIHEIAETPDIPDDDGDHL